MSITNDTNEPTVPTIDFSEPKQRPEFSRGRDISRPDEFKPAQRQGQQENRDREEWNADLEQRRNRQLPKRPEPVAVDVIAEIDGALDTLETAAQSFEAMHGKINQPLIDNRLEVERLKRELADAESRLKVLEEKGDSIAQLRAAIITNESRYLGLHGAASAEIIDSLVAERLGPGLPTARIPAHIREECRLHARVRGLDALRLSHSFGPKGEVSKDDLLKALDRLGEKLVALRDYVIADREQNAKQ